MPTTRRTLLRTLGCGLGAGIVQPLLPRRARAQPADGDAAVTARLETDLRRHASFGPKFSAGPGDNATAQWVAQRLRGAGYAVEESTFAAPFFVPQRTLLRSGSTEAPVVAQAPVVTTPPAGITAPLALVRDGEFGELRGRIAVYDAPSARHAALFAARGIGQTVMQAADAGAAAIVIVTNGPSGEAVALNAPVERPFVPVPMAVLAPKDAAALLERAAAGAAGTLTLAGEATQRPSRNLIGRVARGNRWIAISTPRSGWYDCVAERGTGTAVFLELADWAVARFPDHSLFVMNTGGHEYFFAGSHHVLDRAPEPAATVAWAHIGATLAARDAEERDGRWVMLDSVDPQRRLMATEAARAAARDGFRGLVGLGEPQPVAAQAGELSAFTDRGVAAAFAVIGLHRWFHTPKDTLDCVDARLLTPVLRAHQRTLEQLVRGTAQVRGVSLGPSPFAHAASGAEGTR